MCAWIKFKEAGKTTIDELKEFSRGKVAHYKIPKYVRFVDSFPMTVTGKVKKNDMRKISNELLQRKDNDIKILGHR